MVHGGSRSHRIYPVLDESEAQVSLEWSTIGAWRYALGDYGIIQGFGGVAPWTVRIGGRLAGMFRTLEAARQMLERCARDEGYEVTR
jgi:hypothetical protein